jgi:hypothetical protein
MSATSTFREVLCRLSIPDIMSQFPHLPLSWRQRKAEIVATVLDRATAEEAGRCIEVHRAQVGASIQPQLADPSSSVIQLDGDNAFPATPLNNDIRLSQASYLEALTNDTLRAVQCGICGREVLESESCIRRLSSIDKATLTPLNPHQDMVLIDGCVVHLPGIVSIGTCTAQVSIVVCDECEKDVVRRRQPYFSLARGCWVGQVPKELEALTFAEEMLIGLAKTSVQIVKLSFKTVRGGDPQSMQRAIKGTCATYRQNIPQVVQMLEDKLLPLPPSIFSSTLSVAFIGSQKISKDTLRSLFSVSRRRVYAALMWLKKHNNLYVEIRVSTNTLQQLPENDVPREILAGIRYSNDVSFLSAEDTRYNREEDEEDADENDGEVSQSHKALSLNIGHRIRDNTSKHRGSG